MKIAGSTCLVTGATEGIGLEIARAFGAKGARIAVCARTQSRVDALVTELSDKDIDAFGQACDVGDPASVVNLSGAVHQRFGGVDVLINNAGIGHLAPFQELSLEQIDETFAVNVRGVFLVTRAFLPGMIEKGGGSIVNISSLAGKNGFVNGTAYAASKHAVMGFSKSLMLEVREHNVRVITVCPGSVDTPFFDKAGVDIKHPERILQAQDVAQTVVATIELPERAMISELDIRPSNP